MGQPTIRAAVAGAVVISGFGVIQLAEDNSHKFGSIGCHYFLPGPRLFSHFLLIVCRLCVIGRPLRAVAGDVHCYVCLAHVRHHNAAQ